jgi:hypothetical protein
VVYRDMIKVWAGDDRILSGGRSNRDCAINRAIHIHVRGLSHAGRDLQRCKTCGAEFSRWPL